MTALLIILLLLALIFGIGAVLEGIFWLLLIAIAAIVLLAIFGWFKYRSFSRGRTSSRI
jgi:hypothetical protein